jgi:hypothetical protein
MSTMSAVSHEVIDLAAELPGPRPARYQLRIVSRADARTWAHTRLATSRDEAVLLLRDLPPREPLWTSLDR